MLKPIRGATPVQSPGLSPFASRVLLRHNLEEMSSHHVLPPRTAEARALAAALDVAGEHVLCTTLGRAQAALALAEQRPTGRVACWFLDQHHQRAAAEIVAAPNLSLTLSTDEPPEAVNLAVVPLSMSGEAELARDILQSAWRRLEVGGAVVTAVDNPRDRWVREQLTAWFDKVRVIDHEDARVYVAMKDAAPRKVKDFHCEFAFRDCGRLLHAVSRPGVFSHRRVDPGARQLLAAAQPAAGDRVLDIGCGAGVVGLALAARDPSNSVHAVDSHTRAVECTLAGAALNELTNVSAEVNSTGDYGLPNSFDLAVANPPYYGDFAIATRFLDAAQRALKPGGQVLVVTKAPEWYRDVMPAVWRDVDIRESKQYFIVSARKP